MGKILLFNVTNHQNVPRCFPINHQYKGDFDVKVAHSNFKCALHIQKQENLFICHVSFNVNCLSQFHHIDEI